MIFEEKDDGISFSIILSPRASKTEINGLQRDCLRIKVSSPPVDNMANMECIELLSKVFSIAKSNVVIIKGHKSRQKRVYIDGISAQRAQQILDEHII